MDYIGHRRFSLARQMLLSTDKTVFEIATEPGFQAFPISAFCAYFRRMEDKTPSAYRRENR